MSNDEIDKEIAEFCGWKLVDVPGYFFNGIQVQMWQDPTGKRGSAHPRYSTDLDAMWRAEQTLWLRDWGARDVFVDNLCRILDPVNGYRKQEAIDILDADSEQRAQAFIETIKQIKP